MWPVCCTLFAINLVAGSNFTPIFCFQDLRRTCSSWRTKSKQWSKKPIFGPSQICELICCYKTPITKGRAKEEEPSNDFFPSYAKWPSLVMPCWSNLNTFLESLLKLLMYLFEICYYPYPLSSFTFCNIHEHTAKKQVLNSYNIWDFAATFCFSCG